MTRFALKKTHVRETVGTPRARELNESGFRGWESPESIHERGLEGAADMAGMMSRKFEFEAKNEPGESRALGGTGGRRLRGGRRRTPSPVDKKAGEGV